MSKFTDISNLVRNLKNKIEKLEQENVELTNQLYELQNRIDMIETPIQNLNDINLGK